MSSIKKRILAGLDSLINAFYDEEGIIMKKAIPVDFEWLESLRNALNVIEELEWISVQERLPDKLSLGRYERYLVCTENQVLIAN